MLDRVAAVEGGRARFGLLLNPFTLLGLPLTATAQDINRAYEEIVETNAIAIDLLQRCRQILLTPRLRIDAELGGLLDIAPALAAQITGKLKAGAGGEELD